MEAVLVHQALPFRAAEPDGPPAAQWAGATQQEKGLVGACVLQ
mgnify:CR=1 FL=1